MSYTMWGKIGLGIVTLVLISFGIAYYDGKSNAPTDTEYNTLNKDFTGYDRATAIATKALFFTNIRTAEDYKKLEVEKSYITDKLYKEYKTGESYAGTYRNDVIELVSIKGQEKDSGVYVFKLDTTLNGVRNILLVTIDNNIIKEIRSLGDV